MFLTLLTQATNLSADDILDPNAELVLDARLDGRSLGLDILGYQRGELFYISLIELVEALQFPITVDAQAGLAGGWFIREEREFSLDMNRLELISGAQTLPVDPQRAVIFENDIFVESELLEQWLPLSLTVTIRELFLNIEPTETIPLQERLARQGRGPLQISYISRDISNPLMEDPYRFIGHRATDVRLGYFSNRRSPDSDVNRSYNYALLSRGDLGWMTSTLSLTGNDNEDISAARITLERSRFDGPLGLNHVEVGDVRSGGGNRGILIRGGGFDGQQDGQFADNTIPIRGNVLPGWEVELYRNGVLIDFQVVGDDSRYDFPEVPLVFGENNFELVFYGPFGEERRERRSHYVGEGMFGLGSFSYELSATQADETVIRLGDDLRGEDAGSMVYTARASMGIARRLTLSGGVNSFERAGERRENYDAGLSLSLPAAQLSSSYQWLADSQDALRTSLRSRVGHLGFGLAYTQFFKDGLDEEKIPDNRPLWNASLNLNNSYRVPFNFSLQRSQQEFTNTDIANLGLTTRPARGATYSIATGFVRQDNREIGGQLLHEATGTIGLATQIAPWTFRANAGLLLHPEVKLNELAAGSRLRIDSSMAITFDIRHTLSNRLTVYSAGYNWLLDKLMISPRVQYDSNERWVGSVSVSSSFGTRPATWNPYIDRLSQTNSGGLLARVFIDNNNSGQFDAGDTPLEDVRIRAPQAFRAADTDASGRAYLPRMAAYRATDILLDESTLPDVELAPAFAPAAMMPRPGHWATIDLPVIRTLEIEGRVTLESGSAIPAPANRVLVELMDQNGEIYARQRTAFDGAYLFRQVPPGLYQVRIAPNPDITILRRPQAISAQDRRLITGVDFHIAITGRGPATIIQADPESAIAPEAAQAQPEPTPIAPQATPIAPPESTAANQPQTSTPATWHLQLGAFGVRANAEALWQQLSTEFGTLLASQPPRYEPLPQRQLTLLLRPVPEGQAEAERLCQLLAARGRTCLVRELP
ncbi:MAG: SPOR domain-containing protein [Marinobacter sp.]|nr:SPOR domain-containing protein [Marinobacter sp.]